MPPPAPVITMTSPSNASVLMCPLLLPVGTLLRSDTECHGPQRSQSALPTHNERRAAIRGGCRATRDRLQPLGDECGALVGVVVPREVAAGHGHEASPGDLV